MELCWSGARMIASGKRLRTQARSRNIRMISRGQKPLHHLTNEPLQSATVTLILMLCQVPIERSSPTGARSHAPGGARCVAVLRGWPYPTTPFPPPQPGHTPLACRGSRRPGGGRGGRLVRRGVVERERGLPIPCPAGPVDCPRVRCGLGEPAVVVGARSLRVGRPTDYLGARFPHRLTTLRLGTPP